MADSTEEGKPRVFEARMEIEDSMCRPVQVEVLEGVAKTERSCDLKTKKLCMFAGTSQGDEQDLNFIEGEKLNLKFVQINAEIARYQEKLKTQESNENIEARGEGPSNDQSRTSEGIKFCVRFPKSTPMEVV